MISNSIWKESLIGKILIFVAIGALLVNYYRNGEIDVGAIALILYSSIFVVYSSPPVMPIDWSLRYFFSRTFSFFAITLLVLVLSIINLQESVSWFLCLALAIYTVLMNAVAAYLLSKEKN